MISEVDNDDLILKKGKVVNNNSPYKDGRIQVRISGIHPEENDSFENVSNDDLPWIEIISQGFLHNGIGISKVPQIGQWVYVLVPDNLDEMKVVGIMRSSPVSFNSYQKGEGVNILPEFSKNVSDQPQGININEHPELDSSTEYTKSTSFLSESKHHIIVDDTSGNERIKLQHRTGTFFEVRPDGNFVLRTPSSEENQIIIEGSLKEYIQGEVQKIIEGEVKVNIQNQVNLYIKEQFEQVIDGSLTQTIEKEQNLTLNDSLTQTIEKEQNLTLNDSLTQTIQKQVTLTANNAVSQTISNQLDINVQGAINITSGSVINMNAPIINLN